MTNAQILALLPSGHGRLSSDSRTIRNGDVFVAFPGTAFDGRDHIDSAALRGACAALVEARGFVPRAHPIPCIPVENLRRRYAGLADEASGRPSAALALIGVTGTNGKTSVTTWIAQALDAIGVGCGVIGTIGAGRVGALTETMNTTPDAAHTVANLRSFVEAGLGGAAMEVSSHALHQERVTGLAFRYAVFTNLTHDHLDYHGTPEAYAAAKARLFAVPSLRHVILNADDPASAFMGKNASAPVMTFGIDAVADVQAKQLTLGRKGLSLTVASPWGTIDVSPPVVGAFNASNVLAVIAVLGAMGHSAPSIARGVNAITPVRGRMQLIQNLQRADDQPTVVVDYAHTPDALAKAIQAAREITPHGRVVTVFGCGGDRDRAKRPVMGKLASEMSDAQWVTTDNPRGEEPSTIAAQIVDGFTKRDGLHIELDRARAIRAAIRSAGAGDTVLIAGKGHEQYQEIQSVRHPFDDASVAQEALC